MPAYFRHVLCAAGLLAGAICTDALAQQTYPKDVVDFLQSRDDCEDMRSNLPEGLPGHDTEVRGVIYDIRDQCKGTDQVLDRLKHKYADDPALMQKLNSFEKQTGQDPS